MSASSTATTAPLLFPDSVRVRPRSLDTLVLAAVAAVVYLLARPPIYERDGYVYHLLGRDLRGGTNPHHLLWNALQFLVNRVDAVAGVHSPILFQLLGIACTIAAAVLLQRILRGLTGQRAFAFAAALFVALAPWTWFMAYQNQPYASMFLLFVAFLGAFATSDGKLPEGWRFAVAAASAVGMIALQEAAVLIVVGAGVCFLVVGSWRRAAAWALATGVPVAVLYTGIAALVGVRSVHGFWLWVTTYLRAQHGLQVHFPDFLSKSVMGIISAFVNQEPFKDAVVDDWSNASILVFYGAIGLALLAGATLLVLRRRRTRPRGDHTARALVWVAVASMAAWGVFCFLWEPTNYYWFILLAPFFIWVAAVLRPSRHAGGTIAAALLIATAWNLYADHQADIDGTQRAPGPQMQVIEAQMRPDDLLWVVDLGWSDGVDYDLLSTISAFDKGARIAAVSDVVGRATDAPAWQRALADSTQQVFTRGGRVFVSGRIFDAETYEQRWEQSPFADYEVPRLHPVDWKALGSELPTFLRRRYALVPAGFSIGGDTILELRR